MGSFSCHTMIGELDPKQYASISLVNILHVPENTLATTIRLGDVVGCITRSSMSTPPERLLVCFPTATQILLDKTYII